MSVRERVVAVAMAGALATLAVAWSGSPADAGPVSTRVRIKISRSADGPFKSKVRLNIDNGKAKSAYLRVKSLTGDDEPAFLFDDYLPNNLVQRYFLKNGTEITTDVTGGGGGYLFTAKGTKPKLFRLKVHRNGGGVQQCWNTGVQDDSEGGFSQARVNVNQPDSACL